MVTSIHSFCRLHRHDERLKRFLWPSSFFFFFSFFSFVCFVLNFQQSALSLTNQQATSRPIQQAYFSSVIPTSTTNFNGTKTISSSAAEIFLPTLKQSNEKHQSIPVEKAPTHKSLFDAISSSQRVKKKRFDVCIENILFLFLKDGKSVDSAERRR